MEVKRENKRAWEPPAEWNLSAPVRQGLQRVLGGSASVARLSGHERLKSTVFRLRFETAMGPRSFIVKRSDCDIAHRNRLVVERWLPFAGLGERAPLLLDLAAEPDGRSAWQIYEDLGDWMLETTTLDEERVTAAVSAIAELHVRFAEHGLLGECRLWGGDLGMHFYRSSVRDAIHSIQAIGLTRASRSAEERALLDRLRERLEQLQAEEAVRAQTMIEYGGPETLLHGDLWPQNVFVIPSGRGLDVRLIDWDHAAVGPPIYDLSTLLYRFASEQRQWVLETYLECVAEANWRLPEPSQWNVLFETAECARIANRVIWPAIAILDGETWGFDELEEVERWFDDLKPVLPCGENGESFLGLNNESDD